MKLKIRDDNVKKQGITLVVLATMVVSMFSTIGFVGNVEAHITEGQGHPLQLYSYFYNNDTVTIDGHIAGDASFWARAYARNMTFISNEDPSDTIPVSMFFLNSNSYLYIGIAWDAGNNGANNGVWVFLDEGDNAGLISDGNHLDALTNPSGERNEDGLYVNKNDGSVLDLNWDNGASTWQSDIDVTNKVIDVFNFGNGPYFNAEIRIPLSTGNDDLDDSNLDVTGFDEIGIYVIVEIVGGGGSFDPGHYYWDSTNVQAGNKNSGGDYEPLVADGANNQWGDLRLGLERDDTKLYSTVNINGMPTVDGNINDDLAWINAYKRDMKFTNFQGSTMEVRFYSVQDQTTKDIWCGFWVEDNDFNANDEFYIYQERETATNPGTTRDFLMDTDYENMMYVEVGGTWDDWEYDTGTWNDDETDQVGDASIQFFPSPTPHYEIEFEIPYDEGSEDLNMIDNGLFGFFMKFVDTDMPAGEQEFFWEMTANDELMRLNEADDVHVSVGWIDLQMGGPAVSPVLPDDGGIVSGIDFLFKIYAEDEQPGGINDIVFAAFKTENMDTFKNLFQETGTGFWSTYWDTTSEPNGPVRVTIVAQDDEGITVYLYLTIMISNAGAAGNPPSGVTITSPVAPGPLSGVENIDASAFDASYVEFYIDGELFAVDDTGPYQASLDTTLYSDGGHIISIRAVNIAGETMDAEVYTFENYAPAPPTIASIIDGQYLEGEFTFQIYSDGPDIDHVDLTVTNEDTMVDIINTAIGYNSGSGYYEYTLDTSAVSDGNYSVSALAWDAAGNSAPSATVMFQVDNNAPTLDVTTPLDGSFVSGNVVFTYSAMDTFLDSIMYKVDGNSWNSIGTWDTTVYDDGEHTVMIKASDDSGHETTQTLSLIVDNTNPTVNIINPQLDQYIQGVYIFRIFAQDGVDVEEVMISISNSTTTLIADISIGYNSATGYYEYSMDTTVFEDGDYSIQATSYDASGLDSGSMSVDFQIDNTPPHLTIISPHNNAFISSFFDINVTAADVFLRDTTYNVDGSGWVDVSVSLDTTTIEDGIHTLQIRARDYAGHETIEQLSVRVDNNSPTIGVASPASDQFIEGVFIFKIITNDAVGIEEVRITVTNTDSSEDVVDDSTCVYNSESGYYEYTFDTNILADGNYSISGTSYDLSGKSSSTLEINFQIDNNLPQLVITYPLNGELVTGNVQVSAHANDVFLWSLEYRVDGSAWVDLNTAWDTTQLVDGNHILEIRATDEAGHSYTQVMEIRTDNNAPLIYIVSAPLDNSRVGSSFFVQVYAEDLMGIAQVTYRFDVGEDIRIYENPETGFYEVEVVTDETGLDIDDGAHDFTISAMDRSGLSTEVARNYTVDNTGPDIIITKPGVSKKVNGDVEFLVSVVDGAGVNVVYIRIDKGSWMEMKEIGEFTYSYTWNSRKVYNGKYDVDVKAGDALGNEMEESITVEVDNFPMFGFLIFIVVLVILLVLMMLSWGKKPKKASTDDEKFTELAKTTNEETGDESKEESEAEVVFECPDCGASITSSATVCPDCGTELEGATSKETEGQVDILDGLDKTEEP